MMRLGSGRPVCHPGGAGVVAAAALALAAWLATADAASAARKSSRATPPPATAPAPAAEGVYTLYKDGTAHEIPTLAREGEDFLALSELARALGATVAASAPGSPARIELKGSEIEVRSGAGEATVNGRPFSLSRPAIVERGRMWVPTDFVTKVLAAALERAVKWKDEASTLLATSKGEGGAPLAAEVEVRSQRDYTRVLVRVPGAGMLPYTINAPSGRIVLRIQADNLSVKESELLVGDGALERVGFELQGGRGTFTLELGSEYRDYQHAPLRDPFRVVIDLYRRSPYTGPANRVAGRSDGRKDPLPPPAGGLASPATAPPVVAAPDLATAPGTTPPGAEPVPGGPAVASDGEIRSVVIDAGHGGGEPGARGPNGLLEKELTLDLARRLARQLESGLGVRVVLTRSADIDLSLDDRTGIANHEKADLFVSIHANASPRANAHGAETYFLARGATDDESRKLAALENQVLGEARGLEGTDLELILWSLAQNQYLKESQDFAETIQRELNDSLGMTDRGVKQAPFKVLVGATMPAVLVEVGFITNPEEEKRLRSEEYKTRLVSALFESVRKFKLSRAVKMGEMTAEPGGVGAAAAGRERSR